MGPGGYSEAIQAGVDRDIYPPITQITQITQISQKTTVKNK